MSRGDFGYGSTRTAYSDEPSGRLGPYSDEPFGGGGYQGALGRGRRGQERRPGYSVANELSDKIGSNIFQINNNATTLDRALKQLGTNRDSTQLRQRVHNTEQNTNQVIAETAHFFKQYSQSCRGADRVQKLQFERLKNEFRETAQRYNSLQKELAQKVKSTSPVSQGPHPQELISWTDEDETRHSDRARLLQEEEQQRQQLQAQEVVIETDVALIQEREEQIRQLEGDILDINEIFRDLATLVHEQGETINSIEDNVVMAHDQVGAGNEQLSQAAKYQKKARKKLCCIVIVVVVVAAIIALIIFLSVKKK